MNYLIAGHGHYAEGVYNTLKFFKDDLDNVMTLAYTNHFEADMQEILNRFDGQPFCVVTDLVGGSLNLEAMRQLQHHDFHLLSGVNISLLLELLFSDVSTAAEIEEVVQAAREQMVYVNEMIGARGA